MKAQQTVPIVATFLFLHGLLMPPAFAADPDSIRTKPTAAEQAQQLLKDLDEAQPKAKRAEKIMRDSGWDPATLGFREARVTRDKEAASGSKSAAYNRYAKKARQLERQAQSDAEAGRIGTPCLDIARLERFQAEVDLARVTGLLPVLPEKESLQKR